MKLLLVNPPLVNTGEVNPPLALCVLGAHASEHGHEFQIVDFGFHKPNNTREFSYQIQREFENILHEGHQFDLALVTSMYNNSLHAKQIISYLKVTDPDLPVVAGGPHFGALAELSLRRIPDLDYVISGEGEIALVNLLDAISGKTCINKVLNLSFRREGEIVSNLKAPLLDLSLKKNMWPAVSNYLDLSQYVNTHDPTDSIKGIYIEAGRGCPFSCTFCAPAQFWDRKYRTKEPSVILDEMEYLHKEYGYDYFMLVHDLLFANRNFAKKFCKTAYERKLNLSWMANARFDIDLTDMAETLASAGCNKLFFGVESASPRLQKVYEKNLSIDNIKPQLEALNKAGITATCSFVIGHPTETASEIFSTIKLGARLRMLGAETVQFHRLRAFPPAPLKLPLSGENFDLKTLTLEFPFDSVSEEDLLEIRSDPDFFSGYFAPSSSHLSASEITSIEHFFQLAVSLAPVAVWLLMQDKESNLVECFIAWHASNAAIERSSMDDKKTYNDVSWRLVESGLEELSRYCFKVSSEREVFLSILKLEKSKALFKEEARNNSSYQGKTFDVLVNYEKLIDAIKNDDAFSISSVQQTKLFFQSSHKGEVSMLQLA